MSCGNSTNTNKCCSAGVEDIERSLILIGAKTSELTTLQTTNLYTGYECKECEDINSDLDKLALYSTTLEEEHRRIINTGKGCIECDNLQKIIEKVVGLTGNSCSDVYSNHTEDVSGQNEWIINNNRCYSVNEWERASFDYCRNLRLDISAEYTTDELCNLSLEIEQGNISKELTLMAKAYTKAKELDLELSKEVKSSDVKLDLHRELLERNVSINLIREAERLGVRLKIERDEVCIETDLITCKLEKLAAEPKCNLTLEKLMSDYGKP